MVRWGLIVCAVLLAVMLFVPVPMAPAARNLTAASATDSGTEFLGRVGTPPSLGRWPDLPPDSPEEVPAPRISTSVNEVSSFSTAFSRDAAGAPPRFYRIANRSAILRAGPDDADRAIFTLHNGQMVEALTSYQQDWLFVRVSNGLTEGYANRADLIAAN